MSTTEEFNDTEEEREYKKDCLHFHEAAAEGDLDSLKRILAKYVADPAKQRQLVEDRDYNENTPLDHAASSNRLEIVKYLLEVAAEDAVALTNAQNKRGDAALHFATHHGHYDVVRYLVESGRANACVKDRDGNTPLHFAAEKGHLKIVEYLLQEGKADINAVDCDGCTPLHKAAYDNRLDIVHYLVSVGKADLNAKNEKDETPFIAAKKSERQEIALYLASSKIRLLSAEAGQLLVDILGEKMNETKRYLAGHKPIVTETATSFDGLFHVYDLIDRQASSPTALQWRYILEALSEAIGGAKSLAQSCSVVNIHVLGDGKSGKSVVVRLIKNVLEHGTTLMDSMLKRLSQPDESIRQASRGVDRTFVTVTEIDRPVTYVIHDYESQDGLCVTHANSLNVANSVYCIVVPMVLFEDDADRNRLRSEEEILDRYVFWTKFLYSVVKKCGNHKLIADGIPQNQVSPKIDSSSCGIPLVTILNRFQLVHVPPEHIVKIQASLSDYLKKHFDVVELTVDRIGSANLGNVDFFVPSKNAAVLDLAVKSDVLELIQELKKCFKVAALAAKSKLSPILVHVLQSLPTLLLPMFSTQIAFKEVLRSLIVAFDHKADTNTIEGPSTQIINDALVEYSFQSLVSTKKIYILPVAIHGFDLITAPQMLVAAVYSDLLYWVSRHGPLQKLLHEQPHVLQINAKGVLDRLREIDRVRKHAALALKEAPSSTSIDLMTSLEDALDSFHISSLLCNYDVCVPFSDGKLKGESYTWLLSLCPPMQLSEKLIFDNTPDCEVKRYFRLSDFKNSLVPGFFTKLIAWILRLNPGCAVVDGFSNAAKISGQMLIDGNSEYKVFKQILLYQVKEAEHDGFIVSFSTSGRLPRHVPFDDLNAFRSILYSADCWGLDFEEFCVDCKSAHPRQPLMSVEAHVFGVSTSVGGDPKSRLDEKVKAKDLYFGRIESNVFQGINVNTVETMARIPLHVNDWNQKQMLVAVDTSLALLVDNSIHSFDDLKRQAKNFVDEHEGDKRWKVYQMLKIFCSSSRVFRENHDPSISLQYFEELLGSYFSSVQQHPKIVSSDAIESNTPIDIFEAPLLMSVRTLQFSDQPTLHTSYTNNSMSIYRATDPSGKQFRTGNIYLLQYLCQVCGKVPTGVEGYRVYKGFNWFQRSLHSSYQSMNALKFSLVAAAVPDGVTPSGVASVHTFGGTEGALRTINGSFHAFSCGMAHDIPVEEVSALKLRLETAAKNLPRDTMTINQLTTLTNEQIQQSEFKVEASFVQQMQSVARHLQQTYPDVACGLVRVTRNHPQDAAWVCCDSECLDIFHKTGRALLRFKL